MEAETKHSPGLFDGWELAKGEGEHGPWFVVSNPLVGKCGVLAQRGPMSNPADTLALGHMLHAAPDLYAAVEKAHAEFAKLSAGNDPNGYFEELRLVMCAAIWKARGESR